MHYKGSEGLMSGLFSAAYGQGVSEGDSDRPTDDDEYVTMKNTRSPFLF
jgi:hypothetical protein